MRKMLKMFDSDSTYTYNRGELKIRGSDRPFIIGNFVRRSEQLLNEISDYSDNREIEEKCFLNFFLCCIENLLIYKLYRNLF